MNKLFSGLAVALAGVCAFAETYTENATVAGDEPLVIAAGEKLEFDVAEGATVTVTRVISGEGVLLKKGGGELVLDAVNTFAGGVEINCGYVVAARQGCLGTGPVVLDSSSNLRQIRFNAPEARFANDIRVYGQGGNPWVNSRDVDIVNMHVFFQKSVTLDGDIRFEGGNVYFLFGSEPFANRDVKVVLNGDLTMSHESVFQFLSYGDFTFNGFVDVVRSSANTFFGQRASCQGILRVNSPTNRFVNPGSYAYCYQPAWQCGAVNALGTDFLWTPRYTYNGSSINQIDLNGCDQRIKGALASPFPGAASTTAATGDGMRIFSEKPATVTFTGYSKNDEMSHVMFGREVSFVYDAPGHTLVLTNRAHTMQGAFIVSNGMVRTEGAVSFKQASRVEVAQGAKFTLVTSLADPLTACGELAVDGEFLLSEAGDETFLNPDVSLGADAKLTLGETAVVRARQLVVAGMNDGQPLPAGTYTHAEVDQIQSGTLVVGIAAAPTVTEPIYIVATEDGTNSLGGTLPIKVVRDGVTNDATVAETAFGGGGTFVKRGEGYLLSSDKLQAFTGVIVVENGVFAVNDNLQTGPKSSATAPDVWILPGASFGLIGTKSTCGVGNLKLYNKFHFAGVGYRGQGVMINQLDASQAYVFNNLWTIESDVRITSQVSTRWDWSGDFKLSLRRNTLEFYRDKVAWTHYISAWKGALTPGTLRFCGMDFHPEGGQSGQTDAKLRIEMRKSADGTINPSISWYNSSLTTPNWSVDVPAGVACGFNSSGSAQKNFMSPGNTGANFWSAKVNVDGKLAMYSSTTNRGCTLLGTVSGTGSLTMRNGLLQLANPGNEFCGSVGVWSEDVGKKKLDLQNAGLAVLADGALNPACPIVAVTNAPVFLTAATAYHLPPFELSVPASTNIAFSGGTGGTLAGLRKTGAGALTYAAPLAVTGVVEAVEGVIDTDGKALTVGTLAIAGGTICGDVTVTDAVTCRPDALQDRSFAALTVDGKLTFAPGAKLDLDALVASGVKVRKSGRLTTVVRATGGIDGTPTVAAGGATDAACWSCVVDGDELKLIRSVGSVILVR